MAYGAAGECGDREFEAMEEPDRVSAEFDGTLNVNVLTRSESNRASESASCVKKSVRTASGASD
jgi:hypothetical protein